MEFSECLTGRRSVRRFLSEPLEKETVERIVQAAACSPSWKNSQSVRYVAIFDKSIKDALAEECVLGHAGNKAIINSAPAVIMVTSVAGRAGYERDGSFSTSKGEHWQSFDAGIATQSLCLAAFAEGCGTVIMGIYDEEKALAAAGIEEGQRLSALVAIGRPAEQPVMPKRKTVEELLTVK